MIWVCGAKLVTTSSVLSASPGEGLVHHEEEDGAVAVLHTRLAVLHVQVDKADDDPHDDLGGRGGARSYKICSWYCPLSKCNLSTNLHTNGTQRIKRTWYTFLREF